MDGYIFISPHFGSPGIRREGSSDSSSPVPQTKGKYETSVFSLFTTGHSTIAQEEFSEDEHAVNPMIVDTVSVSGSFFSTSF